MNAIDLQRSAAIFAKTAKGQNEIANRRFGLNPRQRSVLIVMDGAKSLGVIRNMISTDELEEITLFLAKEGFIALVNDGYGKSSPASL